MDYIRFSVDGQRLDYDRKYYSSTDTIDTLYCNFKFETDDLGHILGGWDLPYLWAQFHDEEGNVYIKPLTDNTCSIPSNCLKQLKFKMTLFATDTEDYMTCKKRYTTNEIAFKFKGRANLNYDDGVSPDEPMPTQWQILLDRVDECESSVDTLSQSVSAMESTVDSLSQDVSAMDDRVDELGTGLANESTARANADAELQTAIQTEANTRSEAINNVNSTVNELNTSLAEESATRDSADTRLETLINDRYTKAQTDRLINDESTARTSADADLQTQIDNEVTAREKLETEDIPRWFTEESNHRINGDNNLQSNINSLDTRESNHYSTSMSRMDNLDSRVTANTSTLGAVTSSLGRINNLIKAIDGTGAGFHSSIYRGKYLGDTYTDAQKQAIASGTFDDLFVGDYWTINGVNWRIADFDYYYNIGDTNFTKHHVVIVPDKILYSAQMNSTNITTGCYTGSEMYTTNIDNARTAFDNAFGSSFIPTHRGLYANAVSGSTPSGWAWRDMRVELMNEEQVYGHAVWGACNQNGFDVGTQKTQFKLFALDQTKINIRQYYWLTNVGSSTDFARVNGDGVATGYNASNSFGVRPFACLTGE